jgi:glutathione peroxidase-family protein
LGSISVNEEEPGSKRTTTKQGFWNGLVIRIRTDGMIKLLMEFSKYLIDEQGLLMKYFAPAVLPQSSELTKQLK